MDPVLGPVTQEYGANPQFAWQLGYGHLGRDWGVAIGTKVVSIANDVGTVLWAGWGHQMPARLANECMFIVGSQNSGICVIVQYDGWRGGVFHLDSTHLNVGDKVRRGDELGRSGNTGNSTGPHVHAEFWTGVPASSAPSFGRYNPILQIQHEDAIAGAAPAGPVAIAINVRVAGPGGAAFRDRASTDGKVVANAAPEAAERFVGYVIGQSVTVGGVTSNIWYVDKGEDDKGPQRYTWAGAYTEQKTAGLANLTPAEPERAMAPNQRVTGAAGAKQRPEPKVGNAVVRSIPGGQLENFTHYVRGEKVTSGGITTDLWYKDSVGWVWAGGFTEQSTRGLLEWTGAIAPAPAAPAPVVPEPLPPYTFTKSLPCVTKVLPAARRMFEVGNFPTPPDTLFIHQFNAASPEEDPVTNRHTVHLGSVEWAFTNGTPDARVGSAHWGLEALEVDQFLAHTDRAYHAGTDGNDAWSVEVYGGMDAVTLATLGRFIRDLEALRHTMGGKGRLRLRRHNEVMKTACGAHVDLDAIRRVAYPEDYAVTPAPVPAPPAPLPVPVPETPKPGLDRESILTDYENWRSARDVQAYLRERK